MRTQMTYDMLLSDTPENFEAVLRSEPSDYEAIDLPTLVQKAKERGLGGIRLIRRDLSLNDIRILGELGMSHELDRHEDTLGYRLSFKEADRPKTRHRVERSSSFSQTGLQ